MSRGHSSTKPAMNSAASSKVDLILAQKRIGGIVETWPGNRKSYE